MAVYSLKEKCRIFLNTNGNGWSNPITDITQFNFKVDLVNISQNYETAANQPPCVNLMLTDDDYKDMLVSLPKLEEPSEDNKLSTIWLPFKRKHTFNLHSKSSAFILIRYYAAVIKCYEFQGTSSISFQEQFRTWLSDNILPFLSTIDFYPGFGAILRVAETLKNTDKSLQITLRDARLVDEQETEQKSSEYIQIQHQVKKIQDKESEPGYFEKLLSSFNSDDDSRNDILIITVVCILTFFIIIAVAAFFLTRCTRNKKSNNGIPKFPSKHFPESRKWWNLDLCSRCRKKKPNNDEEIELGPDSPSLMSKHRTRGFSSSNVTSNFLHFHIIQYCLINLF